MWNVKSCLPALKVGAQPTLNLGVIDKQRAPYQGRPSLMPSWTGVTDCFSDGNGSGKSNPVATQLSQAGPPVLRHFHHATNTTKETCVAPGQGGHVIKNQR